jgi:predicted alpha-1,2-mannosidase
MKKAILIIFTYIFSITSFAQFSQKNKDYTPFVNLYIGTGEHGHTTPAASYPFGMAHPGPDTRVAHSGYNYADSTIYGFTHTRLSGIGCPDLLDILFMPLSTSLEDKEKNGFDKDEYKSPFLHKDERAIPGFYSVKLQKYNIQASMTSSKRCAYHQYEYPKGKERKLLIDLIYGNCCGCTIHQDEQFDTIIRSGITIIDNKHIKGYRVSSGWAKEQHAYFYAEFSQPITKSHLVENGIYVKGNTTNGKTQAVIDFDNSSPVPLTIKVGISSVSEEGAKKNLEGELTGKTFIQTKKENHDAWNLELYKIETSEPINTDQQTVFYTALYHSMLCMYTFDDVDGNYRGVDKKIHQTMGWTNYFGFLGFWDIFRAALPLQTLLNPVRINDLMEGCIAYFDQKGLLPIMPLAGNETMCMIGYHVMPVIADAYYKGIRKYDAEKLFEMMKYTAQRDSFGIWMKRVYGTKNYKTYGYAPADLENSAVSKTLEYAYDDYCIAQMAKMLKKNEDYEFYSNRAKSYKKVFDKSSGFMRGRLADGSWRTPFDPWEAGHHRSDFVEGTAWQWTFFVPQDPLGLAKLMGGDAVLSAKLDSLFTISSELRGDVYKGDIAGLIGQYAHGNEPSHHTIYLYNYIGEPWKAQMRLRQVLTTLYTNTPNGLSGDDDTGQMSAWYVMSSMGLYQVAHGHGVYVIGAPQFGKTVLNLINARKFTIEAKNISADNMYIQSAKLNGKNYTKTWITYEDIMNGSDLEFQMGSKPSKWGTDLADVPPSMNNDILKTPKSQKKLF